jgi:hypothetical protein
MSKIEKNCMKCNLSFFVYPSRKDRKYCSVKCANSVLNKQKVKKSGNDNPQFTKLKVTCEYCKKNFYKSPSLIKRTNHNLCSKQCTKLWLPDYRKKTTKHLTKRCGKCGENIKISETAFNKKKSKIIFCSNKCSLTRDRGGFKPQIKECDRCGNRT